MNVRIGRTKERKRREAFYTHTLGFAPCRQRQDASPKGVCMVDDVGWGVFAWKGACMHDALRLRQKSVCTYTASRVPTSHTQEVGNVLEVSGVAVVDSALDVGVTVAVKGGNGLDGALHGVARVRRGAIG